MRDGALLTFTVDTCGYLWTIPVMNTWAPLFSKIVDSSLWREDDLVVKVFLTMLAKKDADQVVRGSAFMIGEWAKKSEKDVLLALKVLSSPDKKRIEKQPFEGRRVEKVEGGWLVLNGQSYEDMMRDINRRAYKTSKQREYRSKTNSVSTPASRQYAQDYENGKVDEYGVPVESTPLFPVHTEGNAKE